MIDFILNKLWDISNYLEYLRYIIRHKYYVFRAGRKIYPPVPYWQLIIHDWTKLLPSEFFAYCKWFYDRPTEHPVPPNYDYNLAKSEFDEAWNSHQKRNKHHWQYWLLARDSGEIIPLRMPSDYCREMLADWIGAGQAISKDNRAIDWYRKNKDKIILHKDTRYCVEVWMEKYYNEKI